MKIGLSGTEGTGKSTLAKLISDQFNVPLIPEYVRDVTKILGITIPRNLPPDKMHALQTRVLDKKLKAESKHQSFIADRTTADNLAYYLRWCCNSTTTFDDAYVTTCLNNLHIYDKILILPWNTSFAIKDGFRSTDKYYRYQIHCLILGILEDQNIKYEILKETDIEERVTYIGSFYDRVL